MSNLDDTCLAIAMFRNDDDVIALLETVAMFPTPFHRVIVVDSMGSGVVDEIARSRGWTWLQYVNSSTNLGSAGNLARRLSMAARTASSFVYAINHDGDVEYDKVLSLLEIARRETGVGAVFPLRRYINRGGRLRSHRGSRSMFNRGETTKPQTSLSETDWSSSNGALYSLSPVRAGLLPRAELWMGWEDLGYGLQLAAHGYRQLVANEVIVDDPYEYTKKRLGPFELYITDKPTWYQYYMSRNLILIGRREHAASISVAKKIAVEFVVLGLLRRNKPERLRFMCAGIVDGILGRVGKWNIP